MTDLETLKAMLTRAKIPFDEQPWGVNGDVTIDVERGYTGFATVFTFNGDGSLKDMGAYE